jgi:hypothetical protein
MFGAKLHLRFAIVKPEAGGPGKVAVKPPSLTLESEP